MTLLDERLTHTENRLSAVLAHSRNIVSVPPATTNAPYRVSTENPYFRGSSETDNDDSILRGEGNIDDNYSAEDEEDYSADEYERGEMMEGNSDDDNDEYLSYGED